MMFVLLNILLNSINPANVVIPIEATYKDGSGFHGTSFLIDRNHIMTAAHVIDNPDYKYFLHCKNKKIEIDYNNVFLDKKIDLAIIKIKELCKEYALKYAEKNPDFGEQVWTIGCPDSIKYCGMMTSGIVSLYRKQIDRLEFLSDMKVWYGNSGGPVINSEGALIGVVVEIKFFETRKDLSESKLINNQNYSIIVPISEIKSFTKRYLRTIKGF